METLTARTPAKLNLTLEILGKRADGYHEIRSVMQAIDMYDTVTAMQASQFQLQCDNPDIPVADNLAARAASLLQQYTGKPIGALMQLKKGIPAAAGLGGGSSDAAATLLVLNRLLKLSLPESDLLDLAARIGSDVPFFIRGGTALAEGKGERLTPLPRSRPFYVVLLFPEVRAPQTKTASLYKALRPPAFTDGSRTSLLAEKLRRVEKISAEEFINGFDEAAKAVFGGLDAFWQRAQDVAEGRVHLSGSGPTLFVYCATPWAARAVQARFKANGIDSRIARPVGPLSR